MWGRRRALETVIDELTEVVRTQRETALAQQDALLALLIETQAERERARLVEQRFEQVCAVIVLLHQELSRLIHNGGAGNHIIVPTYTTQKA